MTSPKNLPLSILAIRLELALDKASQRYHNFTNCNHWYWNEVLLPQLSLG